MTAAITFVADTTISGTGHFPESKYEKYRTDSFALPAGTRVVGGQGKDRIIFYDDVVFFTYQGYRCCELAKSVVAS